MMAFTLEFDDTKLTERLRDPYKGIDETRPLGLSFLDFLSLGEALKENSHIYFRLVDGSAGMVHEDSWFYVQVKEFVDICVRTPELYSLDNFLFFLHLKGLSIPAHYINYYLDPENPPEDLIPPQLKLSPLEAAIRGFAKSDKSKNTITSVYTCDSIEDACIASIYHFLQLGLAIKVCANCGKYFVPLRRSDAIYCDRISPFRRSKTCKEDGSQRTFEEKIKLNEAEKLRRSIYQAKQMRVRRNPDILSYRENFDKWKTDAARWKKDIKKGHRTSEEFIQWLNDCKRKS